MSKYRTLISLIAVLLLIVPVTTAAPIHSERGDSHARSRHPGRHAATPSASLPAFLTGASSSTTLSNDFAHCVYDFTTPMPPGTYCGYVGAAFAANEAVCDSDLMAVWSSYAPESMVLERSHLKETVTLSPVHLSLATDSPIVLRSDTRPERNWTTITDYSLGENGTWVRLSAGKAKLSRDDSGGEEVEILTIFLDGPELPRIGDCALALYEGEFVGVLEFDFTSSPGHAHTSGETLRGKPKLVAANNTDLK